MQVTGLLCDLLFRQVGCTLSQPEISPGGTLPFLTVMHLNLFFLSFYAAETRTITEHSSTALLRCAERSQETWGWKGNAWRGVSSGFLPFSIL